MSQSNTLQTLILFSSLLICFCALLVGFINWGSESRADNWRAGQQDVALVSGEIRAGGQDAMALSKLPLQLSGEITALNGVAGAGLLRPESLSVSVDEENIVAEVLLSDDAAFSILQLDSEFGVSSLSPDTIILKDSVADALSVGVGDTVQLDFESGLRTLRVVALHRAFPGDSHLQFDAMTMFSEDLYTETRPYLNTFASFDTQLYVRLLPTADEAAIRSEIVKVMRARLGAEFGPDFSSQIDFTSADITRLPDLKSQSDRLRLTYGRPTSPTVYRLSLLAAAILFFVGVANYLIMSLVRAHHRSRSAAIKKCLGVKGSHFFIEELKRVAVLALPCLLLAIPLSLWIARSGLEIDNGIAYLIGSPKAVLALPLILAFTLLCLSIVPALLTSSTSPRDALTGKISPSGWGGILRYALLAFQLTTAFALIGVTVTKAVSLNQVLTGDRGFESANLIVVENAGVLGEQISVLDTLLRSQGAEGVSFAANTPGDIIANSAGIKLTREGSPLLVNREEIGYGFFTTLGADIVHGSDLLEGQATQTSFMPVILTIDLAEKIFGRSEAGLIGQTVILDGLQRESVEAEVVGLVQAPKFAADYLQTVPTFYYHDAQAFKSGIARLKSGKSAEDITAFFASQYPDLPLTFQPVTQTLAAYYAADRLALRRLIFLSALAVFLAFAAAYGTTLQMASQARHDLTLRRIIGAPMSHIMAILLTPVAMIAVISAILGTGIVLWLSRAEAGVSGATGSLALLSALSVVGLGLALAVIPLLLRLKTADPAEMMTDAVG